MKNLLWQGFSLLLLLGFTNATQAQEQCATDHFHRQLLRDNPTYKNYFESGQNKSLNLEHSGSESNLWIVPVIVHIFHNDGPENISRAQVLDALRVLNADIQRTNADASDTRPEFQSVAAGANIEFRLATKGPGGECTDGIIRYKTPLTTNALNSIKNLTVSDNSNYLNIYVVRSIDNFTGGTGTILGYASFPFPGQSALNDGIVMRHDVMGTIGSATTGFGPNNQGRILSHEAGHYLGLPHTFDGSPCSSINDGFSDTPAINGSNSGCNWGDSCPNQPGNDQGENYMDYSNGICQNMFTTQQVQAMESALLGARNQLLADPSLYATTNPICAPEAYFSLDNPYVCSGALLSATDRSWNGPVTSRNWEIVGSTFPMMSDSIQSFSNLPVGSQLLRLTASNSQGSTSFQRTINVLPDSGFVPQFYSETFEPPFAFNSAYQVLPEQIQNSWTVNTIVGLSGAQCIYLDNYNKSFGVKENLILPPLNLTQQGSSKLTFQYAFAQRSFDNDDELRVWVSSNCGVSWIPRLIRSSDNLATAPIQPNSEFTPGPAQWEIAEVNLAPYQTLDYVLVRFEFTSGGGNNFFLDDINIFESLGSEESPMEGVSIFPNPFSNRIEIKFDETVEETVEFSVVDIQGRLIHEQKEMGLTARCVLNSESWAVGTYIVSIKSNNRLYRSRVVKQHN